MTTAEKIKQLREDKANKLKEMNALVDGSEKENRSFNEEEKKKYEAAKAEASGINERIAVLEEKEKRDLETAQTINIVSSGTGAANEGGEAGERRTNLAKYSLGRALRSKLPGGKLDGIEAEFDKEERKAVQEGGSVDFHPNSVMIPAAAMARARNVQHRDMDATTATAAPNNEGSFTIQTDVQGIVDVFLPEMTLGKLPVMRMNNLRGNVQFPQSQTLPAAAWETENSTADEYTPKLAKLNLAPKRLAAFVQMSNQLLRQSESNIGQFVRNFLVRASAIEFEKVCLVGGGSNQPTGVIGGTGYQTVYAGGAATNAVNAAGARPVWDDMVNHIAYPKNVNSPDGQAYITSPRLKGRLQITGRQSAGVEGNFILPNWNSGVNGFPMYSTTNLPDTFSKGGSVVLSAIIFGDWSNFVTASWGGMEIGVDPYVNMKEALTNVVLNSYVDCGMLNPNGFSVGKDYQWY